MSALFARCKLPLAPRLDVNSASNFTSASRRIATGSFEKTWNDPRARRITLPGRAALTNRKHDAFYSILAIS